MEHNPLGPRLSLEARHEVRQPIKALADGLPPFLLW